jgi:hypothetical protein
MFAVLVLDRSTGFSGVFISMMAAMMSMTVEVGKATEDEEVQEEVEVVVSPMSPYIVGLVSGCLEMKRDGKKEPSERRVDV